MVNQTSLATVNKQKFKNNQIRISELNRTDLPFEVAQQRLNSKIMSKKVEQTQKTFDEIMERIKTTK